ncbi:protein DMP2-like [Rhodamnia argentea]|uniref:Protein DMP2-like n=1 Tax=Rhodamnia argentea TaxID=178133 RepID=A0A8B8MZ33_9MYRT|nr:protein DMP2-like [Rhodamnia argentea]
MAFTSSPKPKSDASRLRAVRDAALTSLGNLIKLLPTGTAFAFQFLNPTRTNNGRCPTRNEYLSGLLIGTCAFSCAISSFTDSYTGSDGLTHYGIATPKGLWPSPASELIDLSKYKLRFQDFVHALLSTVVFAVVALLDPNTLECFYPLFEKEEKVLLKLLPPVIGAICSVVFVVFPSKRHGIGYPFSCEESNDRSASKEVE